jgi:predicted ATP-dependent protease
MTPEQEQWLVTAAQRHEDIITNQQTQLANHELLISEIREGQAMLAQYFREALDRFDHNTQLADERHQMVMREIRDLRQDFLAHMRAYHPPVDR